MKIDSLTQRREELVRKESQLKVLYKFTKESLFKFDKFLKVCVIICDYLEEMELIDIEAHLTFRKMMQKEYGQ
jgi:hypothetical protein